MTTAPKMRVEISADTPFGAIWAQIWPKYDFLVIDCNDQKKLPQAWKTIRFVQKGLGESICTLQAHFWVLGWNPKFHCFFTSEPAIKIFEMYHMGAHTLPKPFFWKFSTSSKKIECSWYLDRLWVTKTRRVLWSAKCSRTHFFQVKVRI